MLTLFVCVTRKVDMSDQHDRLIIMALRTAIVCAIFMMVIQVVNVVVQVLREPTAKTCVCTPEAP